MSISRGKKAVPALPKIKVSLHYGGPYCTSGQEHPNPALQLAKCPVSHWASVNPLLQPGWQGSERDTSQIFPALKEYFVLEIMLL